MSMRYIIDPEDTPATRPTPRKSITYADEDPYSRAEVSKKKASRADSGISLDVPLERTRSYSGNGLEVPLERSASYSSLLDDVDVPEESIEYCPWNTDNADLFLKVDDSMFPVHRSIISLHSATLRTIIYSVNYVDEETPTITLKGRQPDELKELLSYIYYPQKEVCDTNVLLLLELADEFLVDTLITKCENFLIGESEFCPVYLLRIGSKYKLTRLTHYASRAASRLPGLVNRQDFGNLQVKDQNLVLRLLVEMYEERLEAYSNMYTRWCPVHKDKPLRNRKCCFQSLDRKLKDEI